MLQVGAVVCGVDPGLNYYKINYAGLCLLQNPGCLFIATNADARGHFTPNQEWAGAGATVGAIQGNANLVQMGVRLVACAHVVLTQCLYPSTAGGTHALCAIGRAGASKPANASNTHAPAPNTPAECISRFDAVVHHK